MANESAPGTGREPAKERSRKRAGSRAAKPDLDFGPLSDWLGFRLRMAQTAAFQAFARHTQEFDIRPGRFAVLMLIGRNPGISQTALSRANGRDKSTLTPALADLKRRGLVTRKRIASDRRSYQLFLTPSGERVLQHLTKRAEVHERELERIVGKKHRAQFMAVLRRLATELA